MFMAPEVNLVLKAERVSLEGNMLPYHAQRASPHPFSLRDSVFAGPFHKLRRALMMSSECLLVSDAMFVTSKDHKIFQERTELKLLVFLSSLWRRGALGCENRAEMCLWFVSHSPG